MAGPLPTASLAQSSLPPTSLTVRLCSPSLSSVEGREAEQCRSLRASQSVQLIATKRATFGIALASPGPVTFDLNGATSEGSPAHAWTINWNLPPRNQVVRVCVSLSGPLQPRLGGRFVIPVSHVKARALRLGSLRLHSGTPSAFEGSGPPAESAEHLETFAGSACGTNAAFEVSSVKVTSANNKQGSMKESLMFQRCFRSTRRGSIFPPISMSER